jgi:hypothetical protein
MAKIGIRLPKIGICLVINYGNMALSARWHLLESLWQDTPNFSVVRQMLGIGHFLLRGLIPRMPAKAAPPKDLGFFVAC